MVWLPLISTSVAKSALHEYIEIVPSNERIAWGSDSWTSEEALGALLAYQYVVASVLADKVNDYYLDMDDALQLAEKLMYRNASRIYNLKINKRKIPCIFSLPNSLVFINKINKLRQVNSVISDGMFRVASLGYKVIDKSIYGFSRSHIRGNKSITLKNYLR